MTLLTTIIEHWDAKQSDGGSPVDRIGYGDILAGTILDRALDGTGGVTLVVPFTSPAVEGLVMRQILRIEDPVDGTFEFRINRIDRQESSDSAAVTVTVGAAPVLLDLADTGYVFDFSLVVHDYNLGELTLTPIQWIDTWVLGSLVHLGITNYARGTVDYSDLVTMTVNNQTPLGVLRLLETETGGELRLRHNGATSELIDLIDGIGSTANVPLLSVPSKLTKLEDSQRQQNMASVVIPIRGVAEDAVVAQSIDQFVARVTAVGGSTIDIEDPESAADLIGTDDEFNTWYAVRPDTGALVDITDSAVVNQRLTMAVTGFAVDDIIEFRNDAGGDRITEVPHATGLTTFGRRVIHLMREDVGGRNYVLNPWHTDWADADYPYWLYARAAEAISAVETDWDLDLIPVDLVLPDPTPFSWINAGDDWVAQSTDGGSVSGGAVTVNADDNPGGAISENAHGIIGVNQDSLPDGWHPSESYTRIADGLGRYLPLFFGIDLTEPVTTLDGLLQRTNQTWNPNGVTGGDPLVAELKGLAAGQQLQPGNRIAWDLIIGDAYIVERVQADGAGDVDVSFMILDSIGPVSTDDDCQIERPDWPTALGRSTGRALIFAGTESDAQGTDVGIISPEVYVRAESGWILRATWNFVGYNAYRADRTITAAEAPELHIIDADGDTSLASVADVERVWPAEGFVDVTLIVDHALAASGNVAVLLCPPDLGPRTWMRGMMAVRDLSLSYGPQGYTMTGVEFSAANAAFQACNRTIQKHCVLPRVMTITFRDLAHDDRFVMADEKLTLGGNVRIFSPHLGIDQEARVMRLAHDIVNPLATKVTLDTEPLKITEVV